MTLDYFYGQAGELFSFFRIPKALFQEQRFQDLSTDAKTLYGILLDRMSLSVKNGWLDEQNRVFIIFTIEDVKRALCCADNKATKLLRELEKFGLMDDDAAVLLMVDSNLQRENILPSERAFAYKMKLEALKNQGARSDLTSAQIGPKLTAAEKVAEEANDTKSQVKRFVRLTCLVPELLDMVDEKKIAFNPAVELSYLDESQQRDFLEAMNDTQNAPSLSQAQRLKKLAQEGHFSYDVAFAVMGEEKKDELDKVVIKNDTLRKYFPRSYTPKQMEDTIIKLLEQWQRKQQRQNER